MIRLLSAIDTSEHADTVMEYSRFVASVFRASVTGLCVIESKKIEGPLLRDYLSTIGLDAGLDYKGAVTKFLEIKADEQLGRFGELCRESGLEFDAVVERGIVTRIIESRAGEYDLVILGRRGEHAEWNAAPLGGAVEAVIRGTHKPVLITPRKFRPIGRALIAYDGSHYAKDALSLAADIHGETKLEGVVLFVQPKKDEGEVERMRAEVAEYLDGRGYEFRFETREGDAAP